MMRMPGWKKLKAFQWRRPLIGMEISDSWLRLVRLEKNVAEYELTARTEVPVPPDVLKFSYKKSNIRDAEGLKQVIGEAADRLGGEVTRVGLALPNEIIKVMIRDFEALPEARADREKMVRWWAEKTFRIPHEELTVAYCLIGKAPGGHRRLLVCVGIREVIREYETFLRASGIEPQVIRPAGISQFNFYSRAIPASGITGYLGFFENSFSFLVTEAGAPVFYHSVRTGADAPNFIRDLDMTLQYSANARSDKGVEKLYMPYPENCRELSEKLAEIFPGNIVIMDEKTLIVQRKKPEADAAGTAVSLSAYSTAIGAAQSLAEQRRQK